MNNLQPIIGKLITDEAERNKMIADPDSYAINVSRENDLTIDEHRRFRAACERWSGQPDLIPTELSAGWTE